MKLYQNTTIPLEAQYLYRRGREMIDQQKADTALVYLRQAVFIAPGFSKAYRELGVCLALLGRFQEASVYLGKAARIDPDHGNAAGNDILKGQDGNENRCDDFPTCLAW